MSEYVISDTHWGHEKILQYGDRPFSDVEEMDRVLIENWNDTVDEGDVVYHLGDVRHHPGQCARHYLEQLNGTIVLIRGNHDNFERVLDIPSLVVLDSATLQRGTVASRNADANLPDSSDGRMPKYHFYMEHEPVGFSGWQIHGHSHNNDMHMYPYINPERRTVNVSVEVIGYTPLNMETLVSHLSSSYKRVRTVDDA